MNIWTVKKSHVRVPPMTCADGGAASHRSRQKVLEHMALVGERTSERPLTNFWTLGHHRSVSATFHVEDPSLLAKIEDARPERGVRAVYPRATKESRS